PVRHAPRRLSPHAEPYRSSFLAFSRNDDLRRGAAQPQVGQWWGERDRVLARPTHCRGPKPGKEIAQSRCCRALVWVRPVRLWARERHHGYITRSADGIAVLVLQSRIADVDAGAHRKRAGSVGRAVALACWISVNTRARRVRQTTFCHRTTWRDRVELD